MAFLVAERARDEKRRRGAQNASARRDPHRQKIAKFARFA